MRLPLGGWARRSRRVASERAIEKPRRQRERGQEVRNWFRIDVGVDVGARIRLQVRLVGEVRVPRGHLAK